MSTPAKKTASITVRTDDQLKADLEGLAAADERPLSAYVVKVLRAHVASVKGRKR
jgi:predicted transcriptional regulator